MRLFLVRHGETESNRLGLALGRADVPLNDRGRWQAQRLAWALAAEPLTAVYSSPLRRALDTARPIADRHGLPVQVEEGLIEMDIGEAEGLTYAQVRARFPDFLAIWSGPQGPQEPMPGGERLSDAQARAWAVLEDMASRHTEEAVCAVTHNFIILSVLVAVLDIDLGNFRRLRHSVGAISILDFRPERARLLVLNDTCHLDGAG